MFNQNLPVRCDARDHKSTNDSRSHLLGEMRCYVSDLRLYGLMWFMWQCIFYVPSCLLPLQEKNGKLTHFITHFSHRTTDIYSSYIASRIGDKRSTTFFLIFFPSYSFFLSSDRRSSPAPSFVFVVVATKQQPIHHFIHPLSLPFLCFFHVASTSLCTSLGRNSRYKTRLALNEVNDP